MNSNHSKSLWISFILSALATLATALYFAKGEPTLHPPQFLVLSIAVLSGSLGLGVGSFLIKEKSQSNLLIFFVIQLLIGSIGFVLSHFLFNLTNAQASVVPLAALVTWVSFGVSDSQFSYSIRAFVLSVFIALAFAIALRLDGVFGGLLYGLVLASGYFMGAKALSPDEEGANLWKRAVIFGLILVIGRAAIQYYLLESNYATLGVVINHPYSFVALFMGIFLPAVFQLMEKDRAMPTVLLLVLFGALLPVVLGSFIHVRPMAGYLLGLSVSAFMVGIFFSGSSSLSLLVLINLLLVPLSMPLFKNLSDLGRMPRIYILGGTAILAVILFLFVRLFQSRNHPQQA
ncbi:MAG: hypothetical protein JNK65_03860 [Deltaproteobacteria bacterium]|nr:hypothetical protein [Deltaproteobacteria bacterium]